MLTYGKKIMEKTQQAAEENVESGKGIYKPK